MIVATEADSTSIETVMMVLSGSVRTSSENVFRCTGCVPLPSGDAG